jgi:very-short-patch-repair endonuclease
MRRTIIRYNAKLVERARQMQNNPTMSEQALWMRLKGNQVRGVDFHRQKPIGNYIVDFYAPDFFLALEVDGSSHDGRFDEDLMRQESLEMYGVSFLRFTDTDVLYQIDSIIETIERWIDENRWSIIGVEE